MTEQPLPRHTIVLPNSVPVVAVLGPRDEFLRIIEREFDADIHVRGNQVNVDGPRGELALLERLFDELVTMVRTGQGLTADAVERSIAMLRAETEERPADVLTLNILSNRGRTIRPEDAEPEALCGCDRLAHRHLRHRPGRDGEDLPRHGEGGPGSPGQAGDPDHPDPPRRRGR